MSFSNPPVNNKIANWLSAITHEALSNTQKFSPPVSYKERYSYVLAFDQTRPYSFSLTVDKKNQLTCERIVELLTNSDCKVGYQSRSIYYKLSRPESITILSCHETPDVLKLVIQALPFGDDKLPTIELFKVNPLIKTKNLTRPLFLKIKIN